MQNRGTDIGVYHTIQCSHTRTIPTDCTVQRHRGMHHATLCYVLRTMVVGSVLWNLLPLLPLLLLLLLRCVQQSIVGIAVVVVTIVDMSPSLS